MIHAKDQAREIARSHKEMGTRMQDTSRWMNLPNVIRRVYKYKDENENIYYIADLIPIDFEVSDVVKKIKEMKPAEEAKPVKEIKPVVVEVIEEESKQDEINDTDIDSSEPEITEILTDTSTNEQPATAANDAEKSGVSDNNPWGDDAVPGNPNAQEETIVIGDDTFRYTMRLGGNTWHVKVYKNGREIGETTAKIAFLAKDAANQIIQNETEK